MIEQAVFTILSTDAAVSALVVDRINPVVLEQDTAYPAIVYRRESSNVIQSMTSMTILPRIEINCFADGQNWYADAKDLSKKVRLALTGFTGPVPGLGFSIISITFEGDSDQFSQELKIPFVSADYTINYCEV